jgi:hypothetical protein
VKLPPPHDAIKVSADFENAEKKFNERLQKQLEMTMKEAEMEKKTAVAQMKKDMESLVENMKAERGQFEELYLKVRFPFCCSHPPHTPCVNDTKCDISFSFECRSSKNI